MSHITDKPIVGVVTNIRKKNIFINYNDIEFILPFEKSDKVKYNISDKIMFVYDYMESNYIYKVFSYENNMMVEKESISFAIKDNLVPLEIRGIYAGDSFYLVNLTETRVYNLSDILSNENATLIKEINY